MSQIKIKATSFSRFLQEILNFLLYKLKTTKYKICWSWLTYSFKLAQPFFFLQCTCLARVRTKLNLQVIIWQTGWKRMRTLDYVCVCEWTIRPGDIQPLRLNYYVLKGRGKAELWMNVHTHSGTHYIACLCSWHFSVALSIWQLERGYTGGYGEYWRERERENERQTDRQPGKQWRHEKKTPSKLAMTDKKMKAWNISERLVNTDRNKHLFSETDQ